MTSLKKILVAATLAVSSAVPVGVAEAMPLSAPTQTVKQSTDVTNVRVVCGRYRCRRVWRPRAVYVVPRVVIRQPRVVVRRGYSSHVNWCLNRYKSYDPSSNTFVTYGGEYRTCISPYR